MSTSQAPQQTNLVEQALAHIASIHPEVVSVVYDRDLRWHYRTAQGTAPKFNKSEDIGLLEDAADEAYERCFIGKTIEISNMAPEHT